MPSPAETMLALQRQGTQLQTRTVVLLEEAIPVLERIAEGPPAPGEGSDGSTEIALLRAIAESLQRIEQLLAAPTRSALVRDSTGRAIASVTTLHTA